MTGSQFRGDGLDTHEITRGFQGCVEQSYRGDAAPIGEQRRTKERSERLEKAVHGVGARTTHWNSPSEDKVRREQRKELRVDGDSVGHMAKSCLEKRRTKARKGRTQGRKQGERKRQRGQRLGMESERERDRRKECKAWTSGTGCQSCR